MTVDNIEGFRALEPFFRVLYRGYQKASFLDRC